MRLFEDHAFLIFLGLLAALLTYVVCVLFGKPVDERIVGTIGVGLSGGLLGFANRPK